MNTEASLSHRDAPRQHSYVASLSARVSSSRSDSSLYDEIERHLTRDGMIERSVALDSLTAPERCLLEMTKEPETVRRTYSEGPWLDDSVFVFLKCGPRIGIKPACFPGLQSSAVLGAFSIAPQWQDTYLATKHSYYKRLTAAVKRVVAFLEAEESENKLGVLIDRVEEAVDHLAPIINFVGDRVYSGVGYWDRNIGGKKGNLLPALRAAPVRKWNYEDCCFLFAMSVMLETGGAYRLEELNWCQIDPLSLERHLLNKFRAYSLVVPELGEQDLASRSLHDLAAELRRVEQNLPRGFALVRKINGPTLNKRVCVLPRRSESAPLPSEVVTTLGQLFPGAAPPSASDPERFVRWSARRSVELDCVPTVVSRVLRLALDATDSDFTLSRCNRRFYLKQDAKQLTQNDFFCAVECSARMRESTPGRLSIGEVMWRQSKRMLFNCWKFWHGNLGADERAVGQYWFIPPRMGDLSYFEDQLHAGHAQSLVAQALRVPGEITFHDVETGATRTMIGAMDIRAARATMDRPYGTAEYITVVQYAQILNWFYAELASMAVEGRTVEIEAFRREDFTDVGDE